MGSGIAPRWISIGSEHSGGFVYGQRARAALERDVHVEFRHLREALPHNRALKPLALIAAMFADRRNPTPGLRIVDDMLCVPLLPDPENSVVVIHHLDHSVLRPFPRLGHMVIDPVVHRRLRRVKAVVTVSEYWRQYFLARGCERVHKIYSGLRHEDFVVSDSSVTAFRDKYGFTQRPIVYIGNRQRAKGVEEVALALAGLPVDLVTSGHGNAAVKARHLLLQREEYLQLLKSASVAITMSRFNEGWCLTAHEAMMLKTPVIGSGRGGMRELLEGGGQIVCPDISQLRSHVEALLADERKRSAMTEAGHRYASTFTMERFTASWRELLRHVTND